MPAYSPKEKAARDFTDDFRGHFIDAMLAKCGDDFECRRASVPLVSMLFSLYIAKPGDVLDRVNDVRDRCNRMIADHAGTGLEIPPIEKLWEAEVVWRRAQDRESKLNSERQRKARAAKLAAEEGTRKQG